MGEKLRFLVAVVALSASAGTTIAADAWYHGKVTTQPAPADLPAFAETVALFAGFFA